MAGAPDRELTLRSLVLPLYLPSFLLAVGEGAITPFIVLAARELGASVAVAGFIFALAGIATLLFNLPAGTLVARVGERRAMSYGTLLLLVALWGCVFSNSLVLYAASVFLLGVGWSVWKLARLTYVTDMIPPRLRGRALSTLGGSQRAARFVGPLLAAAAIELFGLEGAFYIHAVAALAAWGALFAVPAEQWPDGDAAVEDFGGFLGLGRGHARIFRRVGSAVLILGIIRTARPVLIPLWGVHIGLDASSLGIVFAAASAVEMSVFYPAGYVMDRWGRKFVTLPSLALLSVTFLALPAAGAFVSLLAISMLGGFANGLGSGIVMTLGSDVAPVAGRAQFLSMWRFVSDAGQASGPLIVSAVGAVATVGTASVAVGLIGLLGALLVVPRMPETLVEPRTR